jgi:hypothetical protein
VVANQRGLARHLDTSPSGGLRSTVEGGEDLRAKRAGGTRVNHASLLSLNAGRPTNPWDLKSERVNPHAYCRRELPTPIGR